MPVTPDTSVFERNRGFADYQRANDEFMQRKALQQAQIQQAMQKQDGLSVKDLLGFQIAMQNQKDNLDLRRDDMSQRLDIAKMNIENTNATKQATKDEKRNQKYMNDQNALTGILTGTDEQIAKIDALFDKDGNLTPDAKAVYGTVGGVQLPYVFQSTIDAKANIDNIINNSVFQKLGELKSQSATGASGLGSLSNSEGTMLKSSATAAGDYKQSPQAAAKNLKAYKAQLLKTRENFVNGFNNIYGDMQPAQPNQKGGSKVNWGDL